MTVSVFADTNLFVYAESEEQDKTSRAIAIIQNFRVISTQVINEAVSVPIRKHGFLLSEAHEIAESLLDLCEVVAVDAHTAVRKAIDLAGRYSLAHWDSLIVQSRWPFWHLC